MKTIANIAATILIIVGFSGIASAKNIIDLSWTTRSETNNHFFTIERSVDGITWETIATITGAGTSSTKHSYVYSDKTAPTGTVYYNLMQTDINGETAGLKVISVENNEEQVATTVIVYPNPTTSFISLKTDEKVISASIVSTQNKIIKELGSDIAMANVQDLNTGVYYLIYTTDSGSINTISFVKK